MCRASSGVMVLYLESIHIAGTKGKGSVAAFISNILRKEGYKVGTYTRYNLCLFFQINLVTKLLMNLQL